jgi:tRNA threonylcarbamoyl adenosine modification protein YeaZ
VSVLAIDTSSRGRAVLIRATADGRLTRAEVRDDLRVGVAVSQSLASLLDDGIDAVVVVNGPGSYTGVRGGMAAALGVAHARDVPLHCIGALEVIAAAVPEERRPCWIAGDAGRGAVYIARDDGRAGAAQGLAAARRLPVAELALDGMAVFSADALPLAGLVRVDPARALAAAVPLAMARGRVELHGLEAVYVV